MADLFQQQIDNLTECHFLVLYWAAQAEGKSIGYNMTNCFDDLKHRGITRTKQKAVAAADALSILGFVELREHGNRKNIYITTHGAKALEALILEGKFTAKSSIFLEGP